MDLTWGNKPDKDGGSGKVLFANGRPFTTVLYGTVMSKLFRNTEGRWFDKIQLRVHTVDHLDEQRLKDVLSECSNPVTGMSLCIPCEQHPYIRF